MLSAYKFDVMACNQIVKRGRMASSFERSSRKNFFLNNIMNVNTILGMGVLIKRSLHWDFFLNKQGCSDIKMFSILQVSLGELTCAELSLRKVKSWSFNFETRNVVCWMACLSCRLYSIFLVKPWRSKQSPLHRILYGVCVRILFEKEVACSLMIECPVFNKCRKTYCL